ncbi:MAG TPA: hypothetical protein VFL96_02075, partial [Acidobacteriaceae bacterium]|nr:hypothetical protein [Acidobacteriaceae bacterium]
ATADSVWAAGAAAMTGASSAGIGVSMAAAAIGGAVGNAAGQLVGDAEGIHQGFSWGEVAGAGLGAGITAGLSGVVSGGEEIKTLASEGGFANDARIAGIGASSVIGNYAGEKLAGQPAHFSWANVAAAAISTEITAQMHLPTTLEQKFGQAASGEFGANLLGGLVNGAIDSETARLLGGDAQNGRQIVEDAFGNALGNAAIGEIEQQNARTEAQQQTSSDETPVWLRADSGTQGNSALAYLNGPFASQTDGMLAGYNPFNGALLASSNDYATFTGVYGLQGSTAASALDSSGHIPGQPYIGYLGPNGEFVSPPDGDVYLQSAYDHNADGTDATQDGVPLSDSPTLVVSATPAEVAAAKQGDIYGGLSDLQLEMMSTDPSSTRYAELKRQWYAQQYVRDFNNNEYPTAAMGRIVEEENFDRTNQEVAEFGRPLPQMKAYDPNAQAAFGNQIGAILGAPFVTIAAGMSYRGGASEQQVEASEEWAFGTQLMLSGERVPETRSEFEALESEDLTSAAPVNPDIIAAQQSQTSAGYNPDVWSTASLPKGSLVYGGLPGQSEYYTTLHSILDSSFGRENLFQGLQVAEDPDRGYRPEVGIYEVLNDIQVPAGQALANPSLGKGGSSQYFIRNYQQQLKLVGRIPLGQ